MIERYCERNGIDAEFIETTQSTKTAEDAARTLQVRSKQIIKSLVFYVDEDPHIVIVRGPDQVDEDKLAALVAAEDTRFASPDEVEKETGYSVGGVPPVGTDLPKIVDEHVLNHDKVYGGAGSEHRMIGLDPRFIIDEHDMVGDVTAH